MNGKDTDVISRKAPNSKSSSKRGNTGIIAFQHAVHGKSIFLLPMGFLLQI
jgi:hypothetical protein